MPDNVKLTQALSARLCHDLASAIGTIDNCLELMDNSNKSIRTKAKSLVTQDSQNLVSKVKFYRNAYGLSEGEVEMSTSMLKTTILEYFDNTATTIQFNFDQNIKFLTSELAKSVICLCAILKDNIIKINNICLDMQIIGKDYDIKLLADGKSHKNSHEYFPILEGYVTDNKINVNNCREYYVSDLCQELGYNIGIKNEQNKFQYSINKF